jgi:hypothetical protein
VPARGSSRSNSSNRSKRFEPLERLERFELSMNNARQTYLELAPARAII